MRTTYSKIPAYGHYEQADTADRMRHVARIARLMDSEFTIPGTKFRFGLDPVLGLVPVFGNLATSAVSAMLVLTMMRHGASGNVVVRMSLNLLLDAVIGSIPIIGNLFDFAYRANDRNVELLRRHYDEGKYQGSGRGLIAAVLIGLFAFLLAAGWATWHLVAWIVNIIAD